MGVSEPRGAWCGPQAPPHVFIPSLRFFFGGGGGRGGFRFRVEGLGFRVGGGGVVAKGLVGLVGCADAGLLEGTLFEVSVSEGDFWPTQGVVTPRCDSRNGVLCYAHTLGIYIPAHSPISYPLPQ